MKHTMAIIGYGGMGGWHAEKNVSTRIDNMTVKGIFDIAGRRGRRLLQMGCMSA